MQDDLNLGILYIFEGTFLSDVAQLTYVSLNT